ncbi:MAG: hypothetical protein H6705_10000 [Myxococcales bacterium]|nr:hypothetical protein [Myxococcales bacterium]
MRVFAPSGPRRAAAGGRPGGSLRSRRAPAVVKGAGGSRPSSVTGRRQPVTRAVMVMGAVARSWARAVMRQVAGASAVACRVTGAGGAIQRSSAGCRG